LALKYESPLGIFNGMSVHYLPGFIKPFSGKFRSELQPVAPGRLAVCGRTSLSGADIGLLFSFITLSIQQ